MRRSFILPVLLVALLSVVGCANQKSWVYSPNSYGAPTLQRDQRVAVLPFTDERPNTNKNMILMYLLPIPAHGWVTYDVPEGAAMHVNSSLWVNYKPTEDYPKALAEELSRSGIFEEAFFDYKKGTSDLYVKGTILNTRYNATMISYGLSVYGPLLWIVGLPVGTVHNDLSLQMTCADSTTNEVLFTKVYSAPHYRKMSWLYKLADEFNYPVMLQGIYKDFMGDLVTALAAKPTPEH
ncbi:MAG TPA: hypothetical protein PKH07_07950 [bacterium]|nr:hypothetical protein [bacterium]